MRTRRQTYVATFAVWALGAFFFFRAHYERIQESWSYLIRNDHQSLSKIDEKKLDSPASSRPFSETVWAASMPLLSTSAPTTKLVPNTPGVTTLASSTHTDEPVRDRVMVIGRLPSEDMSWVAHDLPHWQAAIYTFDKARNGTEATQGPVKSELLDEIMNNASIRTLPNKGMEANPYLAYIVQNYDNLPSTIAFVHAHRDGYPEAWHTDSPGGGYSNVKSLQQLNIDFIQQNGYANLRCLASPGCSPPEVLPFRNPPEEHRTIEAAMPGAWRALFGNADVPHEIATPCCAQFAVSRKQVLQRPLEEYKSFYRWLMESPLKDETSGRVLEYLWHIIFGQHPVYCPELQQCYCDVYNQC